MRIISLYQPYATLMMLGLKTNETRGYLTHVRGTIGIHATATMPKWCKDLLAEEPFKSALEGIELPKGAILGTVEIIDCVTVEAWMKQSYWSLGKLREEVLIKTSNEMHFGDYTEGRFAWKTINPTPFAQPIPAKGKQGFWNYPF